MILRLINIFESLLGEKKLYYINADRESYAWPMISLEMLVKLPVQTGKALVRAVRVAEAHWGSISQGRSPHSKGRRLRRRRRRLRAHRRTWRVFFPWERALPAATYGERVVSLALDRRSSRTSHARSAADWWPCPSRRPAGPPGTGLITDIKKLFKTL